MHIPVLLQPILDHLLPAARVIDGTVGAGGHSAALLQGGAGVLLGFDLDPTAIRLATDRLAPFGDRAHIVHASYADMRLEAERIGWSDGVDAILLDLGVSSMQFDTPERGFSFRADAPLDMRFDPDAGGRSAADLINTLDQDDLADLIFRYGEERESRRIARAILRARPLTTTAALAAVIERALPRHGDAIHPATRTFQALRIAVNDELGVVERALPQAIDLLRPGGRLAVISFHSLEDRLVKDAFRRAATDCICPPKIPVCVCGHRASVELLTRKPIVADEAEITHNARSRSAKLRVVRKRDAGTR
ncbi:MAG: 16S rRNA (cytosine(1402)-N(4))-methyltransferase RsmH [Anaerolineae bacterium]|nr:16S rRNA (cytosine(1402)-N(4))-methyltransferase RsmH [Anaerolineae bacterium]NUQ03995.1 16S rRNA (cytosine(1402)-N(4))-methyltransferase RsmH [Anaerolineae bacterium]